MRIIAGYLKGRKLQAPDGKEVRPTSDRVREAIFSVLHEQVKNARVLDLYAGSGSLGVEALSRGAKHIVFVEKHPAVVRRLNQNLRHCKIESNCQLIFGDTLDQIKCLGRLEQSFDLIFADPPYHLCPEDLLQRMMDNGIVVSKGMVVIEHDVKQKLICPAQLEDVIQKEYGQTSVNFYYHNNEDKDL